MTRTTREVQATSCVSLGGGITPRFGGSGGGVRIKESFEEVEFKLGLEERQDLKMCSQGEGYSGS